MDPDIRRAFTLPAEIYRSQEAYQRQLDRVFARSWHYIGDRAREPGLSPHSFYEGSLDEPVILGEEDGAPICFSNVCTHRGAVLLENPCRSESIRCRYHGRRFDSQGRFLSMPEFEEAEGFPSEKDDLPRLHVGPWGPLLFAAIDPAVELSTLLAPLEERLRFFDPTGLRLTDRRDYRFAANWALYCDNYLEGFHIPFVHPALAGAVDYSAYEVELFDHVSLQTAATKDPGEAFDLPGDHPDYGRGIGAYYFFLFPTTMINLYPWGLSLNVVEPHGPAETRIRFRSYVRDGDRRNRGAGADLDGVEQEDEEIVLSVQRGIQSRLYDRGRYSPEREQAVHHFHRLLERYMSK